LIYTVIPNTGGTVIAEGHYSFAIDELKRELVKKVAIIKAPLVKKGICNRQVLVKVIHGAPAFLSWCFFAGIRRG